MAKTWREELMVTLTSVELLERGEALALQEKLWRERETRRKAAQDEANEELADIEAEQARLARIVRDKEEPRPVEVLEVRNFTENRVDIVRGDTGEVIRTRVMSDAERQMELVPRIEPAEPEPLSEFEERTAAGIKRHALEGGHSEAEAEAAVAVWRKMPREERRKLAGQALTATRAAMAQPAAGEPATEAGEASA